jgi:glutathione synthase/RimK-type ligase-like ATP-grasp enzyme
MPDERTSTSELLFTCAQRIGMQPKWLTDHLFSVVTGNGQRYVLYSRSSLNSHVGIGLSNNKYITRVILEAHDLPNIPFARFSRRTGAEAFLKTHKTIVAKPIKGGGSKNIHIVTALHQLKKLILKNYIFEKYIPGIEIRYLVLKGKVIAVHRSDYGTSVDEHRKLERISYHPIKWQSKLSAMSLKIAKLLELRFAAVDYLIDGSGQVYILEVNSAPGLKWFHSPTTGPMVDVAQLFLQAILDEDIQEEKIPALLQPVIS